MSLFADSPKVSYFRDEYVFLSNFYPCWVEYEGMLYKSVEHAYQAAKSLSIEDRKKVQETEYAGEAKKLGRKLKNRNDWEMVKVGIMEQCLLQKFNDPMLRERLLKLKDYEIVEGNNWGDTFWGIDDKKGGKNILGRLIMKIRDKLLKENK
jgi:hypothetical protein